MINIGRGLAARQTRRIRCRNKYKNDYWDYNQQVLVIFFQEHTRRHPNMVNTIILLLIIEKCGGKMAENWIWSAFSRLVIYKEHKKL